MILLTAYAGWESAKEAMRLGAFDYFEKGREPDELFHQIAQALDRKALRRENENLRGQVEIRYGLPGIVAAHGGRIDVESKVGGGTRVLVRLPVA